MPPTRRSSLWHRERYRASATARPPMRNWPAAPALAGFGAPATWNARSACRPARASQRLHPSAEGCGTFLPRLRRALPVTRTDGCPLCRAPGRWNDRPARSLPPDADVAAGCSRRRGRARVQAHVDEGRRPPSTGGLGTGGDDDLAAATPTALPTAVAIRRLARRARLARHTASYPGTSRPSSVGRRASGTLPTSVEQPGRPPP